MIYKCKNKCKAIGICSNCQGHINLNKWKLKEKFKYNFQMRNKIRLCDSKP
jgi:hypothetical protein